MSYEQIVYEADDGLGIITLHRPERMNAWTDQMSLELTHAFGTANRDDSVRAIILTGSGRAFCAGADLQGGDKTFGQRRDTIEERREARDGHWPHQLDKPVIAAINGHAVGVGMTLPMMCDIRFVAENAKLQFSFVKRGITPELGSPVIVPRIVGMQRAADLMLSGRFFSGSEAAEVGIALQALPAEDVLARAKAYALENYMDAAPVSVAITKRLLWDGQERTVEASREREDKLLEWIGKETDAKEGVMSFVEKRAPKWSMSAASDTPRELLK